jgi:uncharacterized membrane protein
MVSSIIPATTLRGLKINTLGDGLFHAATWVFTVIGLALLWRTLRGAGEVWSTRVFVGWLLAGWGWLNLVEGLIDHQILGVYHVRPGPHQLAYDLGFLAANWLVSAAPGLSFGSGASAARVTDS